MAAMVEHICSLRPEAGGFLFGPKPEGNIIYVDHFEYDVNGATTGASYVPSHERDEIINRVQDQTGLYFLGVVHSHPRGMSPFTLHPSSFTPFTISSSWLTLFRH